MRIDSEILDKAHALGLNVSKIAENALKDAIDRMERPKTQNDCGNPIDNKEMARDVGIEPTRPFDHRLSRPAPYQARAKCLPLQFWIKTKCLCGL